MSTAEVARAPGDTPAHTPGSPAAGGKPQPKPGPPPPSAADANKAAANAIDKVKKEQEAQAAADAAGGGAGGGGGSGAGGGGAGGGPGGSTGAEGGSGTDAGGGAGQRAASRGTKQQLTKEELSEKEKEWKKLLEIYKKFVDEKNAAGWHNGWDGDAVIMASGVLNPKRSNESYRVLQLHLAEAKTRLKAAQDKPDSAWPNPQRKVENVALWQQSVKECEDSLKRPFGICSDWSADLESRLSEEMPNAKYWAWNEAGRKQGAAHWAVWVHEKGVSDARTEGVIFDPWQHGKAEIFDVVPWDQAKFFSGPIETVE